MTKAIIKMALASALLVSAAATASAQSPDNPLYANVKGWTVNTVWHDLWGFNGCMAFKPGQSGNLIIEFNNQENAWKLIVPTSQDGRFGGAILSVDKTDFDSQFGFEGGMASKELTPTELGYIKSGRELGVEINGDPARYWSLSGSTAAILKVQECNRNQGQKPAKLVQRPLAPSQPTKPPAAPPQPASNDSFVGNCSSPTNGAYPCLVERKNPEAGYVEAYQVGPVSGGSAPSYFFKVTPNQNADAWVSYSGGPWKFMGVWVTTGHDGKCSMPAPNPEPSAVANLGQDAWELCVR